MTKSFGRCLAVSVASLFSAACDRGASVAEEPAASAPGAMPAAQKATTSDHQAAGGKAAGDRAAGDEAAGDKVQCVGIHECKGKSACHIIGSHVCAGQNECKGKGWIEVPRAECEAKGGKILDS